jgi:hypothetical protein
VVSIRGSGLASRVLPRSEDLQSGFRARIPPNQSRQALFGFLARFEIAIDCCRGCPLYAEVRSPRGRAGGGAVVMSAAALELDGATKVYDTK